MHKLNSKLVLTAALSAALLAGCGGGGGSSGGTADGSSVFGAIAASDIGQNIASVFDYINRLIAFNSENSDPVDVNALTLATDETSGPTPLP